MAGEKATTMVAVTLRCAKGNKTGRLDEGLEVKMDLYVAYRQFNNRAVSQVIAALLLIAIAVSAAILLYVFSMGLLGSLGSSGGQQTKEQLILEAYNWSGVTISGSLRNVGLAAVNVGLADVFVNGLSAGHPTGSCGGATLATQQSCAFNVPQPSGTYASGTAYPLKIITPTGGIFSYTIISGGAG
jgi:flagellin-like protein